MWGQLTKITQYTRDVITEGLASGEEDEYTSGSEIENTQSGLRHQPTEATSASESLKNERDSFKKQFNESERKNREITTQLSLLAQEKESKLAALQKQINEEKIRREKAEQALEKANRKFQEQVKSLQNKLIDSVNDIPPQLPSSPEQSKSETGTAENSASDTEHSKDDELERFRRHSLQIQKKNEEIISTLRAQISDDEETINSLKAQTEEEKSKNETLAQEAETIRQTMSQSQRKHEEIASSLMHQIRDNEEVILSLQAEVETEKALASEAQSQSQTLGPNYESIKKELEDLQSFMAQAESDHQNDLELRTFQLRQQISHLSQELLETQEQVKSLAQFREENESLKAKAHEQEQTISLQSAELQRLQEDYQPLNAAFQRTLCKLNEHLENGENLIDKRIVTKLFITYHTDVTQRAAVLSVMSGILNFTTEEQRAVGLITDTTVATTGRLGWVRDWWNRARVPAAQSLLTRSEKHAKSLSELWVEFLLHEAQALEEPQPIEELKPDVCDDPKQLTPSYTVVPALTPQSTPTKPPQGSVLRPDNNK